MTTSKVNLSLLMILVLFTVGCSSKRWFMEGGAGVNTSIAKEEWAHDTWQRWKYRHRSIASNPIEAFEGYSYGGISDPTMKSRRIKQVSKNVIDSSVSLLLDSKVGYRIIDNFFISSRVFISSRSPYVTGGYGVTYFTKTTKRIRFDIALFGSPYTFSKIDTELDGRAIGIGVGYEFRKNWFYQVDFSWGTYSQIHVDPDFSITETIPPGPIIGAIHTYTREDPQRATVFALVFTINYHMGYL